MYSYASPLWQVFCMQVSEATALQVGEVLQLTDAQSAKVNLCDSGAKAWSLFGTLLADSGCDGAPCMGGMISTSDCCITSHFATLRVCRWGATTRAGAWSSDGWRSVKAAGSAAARRVVAAPSTGPGAVL